MPGKKTPRRESSELLDLKEVRQLIDLLIDRGIAEFEMEKDGTRIRILRGVSTGVVSAPSASTTATQQPIAVAEAPATAHRHEKALDEPPSEQMPDDVHVLKSPIVGTYYGSPSPEAPPFVTLGDIVRAGQVLCIIEAMKLMNEIEAEVAGEIVRVYIENGQPVEYGQPLFAIRPTATQ